MAEDKYYDELVEVTMPRKLGIKLKHILAQNPDADIEDVVRCKDCRHLERDDGLKSGKMCLIRVSSGLCDDNDFCSYGERK